MVHEKHGKGGTTPGGTRWPVRMDLRRRRSSGSASSSAAELLIEAMRELSRARTRAAVADVVKRTARRLVGADGASFVLRDRDQCFYLDEDAIAPLWKGQRFPLEACVSGWVMLNAQQVAMPDIYLDARVPHGAYRPTFVKSLVMTPVRRNDPIAAIGIYWAEHHRATPRELKLLQDLADTTAVALENAQVYQELEQRVEERTLELSATNKELEAFSQTVAHDLRTPLNVIIGFAELIAEGVDAARTHQFAEEISASGHRMNGLIGALLGFARHGRSELSRSQLDLSALAHKVVGQFNPVGGALTAEISIEEGLGACADAALIEVVLTNLFSNALKYSSKVAAPRVQFGRLPGSDEQATFFVRDNGAGFDPARAERLFAPFQRLHAESEFPGTGVGLATVARVIRRHGGRVWAESAPGAGATFYFTLPLRAD